VWAVIRRLPAACPLHHEELRPGPEQDDLDAVADHHVKSREQLEDVGIPVPWRLASRVDGREDDAVGQFGGTFWTVQSRPRRSGRCRVTLSICTRPLLRNAG